VRRGDGFFGRESELATLLGALREAASGVGRLLLLAGDPGIGKTRIATELANAATEQGFVVLWGRCHEAAGAPAHWPWTQIARAYREQTGARHDDLVKIERRLAATPVAGPDAAPEQARFALFDRVSSALRTIARDTPLLLVLDDLHWADQSSLKLVQFLGREISSARVIVLGTFREIEPGMAPQIASLLGELAGLGTTIPVRGLVRDDVARLIADRADLEPDQRLVSRIYDATHGNPLFVGEVVRLLVAEHRMSGPAATASLPIPIGVRAAIARRIEALDSTARDVLAAAAVCGREFSIGVQARAMELPLTTLRTALEAAERLGVVAPTGDANDRYVFSHALVRETLYEALPSGTRAAWHRKIGEALEEEHASDLAPYLSELACHFRAAADAAYVERAIDYAYRAGESARRLLAYEEAELELGHALASLEQVPGATPARRCEILVALAEAQRGSGHVDAMSESFRRAIELARGVDAHVFADAVLRFSAARFEASFYDERVATLLEEALARLPLQGATFRARLLARLAAALHLAPGTEERRTALAEEATRMARALGDKATLAWVLMMRKMALVGPDNLQERLALAGEVIRLADESDYPIAALEAQTWRVHDLLELGDIQAVDLAIEAFARRAAALKQPVYLWHLATWRGMRALLDARLDDAEALLGDALAVGQRALQETAFMHYGQQLLALRWEQGRQRELEGLIRMAAEQAPTVPSWRMELCSIELQNERFAEAQAMFDGLAAHDFLDLPRDTNWLLVMISLAYDAAELGDAKRARQLYQLLQPYAGRFVASRPAVIFLGCVSFYLARLAHTFGQRDVAAEHFAHALREHGQLGARSWVARTQAEYARLLAARGHAADETLALELATAAHATALQLGLAELLPRAERALEEVRQRSASAGWNEAEEPRLALVAGGRRSMAAAAGRGGATVVGLVSRRGARAASGPAGAPARAGNGNRAPATSSYALRREGAIWTILFEGRTIRERHSLGLGYIAHLLAYPDREVTAWDLAALDGLPAGDGTAPAVARARRADPAVRVSGTLDQALAVGDARAVAEYRERLAELRGETEEARGRNDLGQLERIDEETRFLESELSRMVGFGSRLRQGNSTAERARLRVTKAIRYAIRKLAAHDAGLAEHLDVSVKTGMLCSYAPRPRLSAEWSIG